MVMLLVNTGNTTFFIERFCRNCFERFYSKNSNSLGVWSSDRGTIENTLAILEVIQSSLRGYSIDASPDLLLYALVLMSKCLIALRKRIAADATNQIMVMVQQVQAMVAKRRHTILFSKVR